MRSSSNRPPARSEPIGGEHAPASHQGRRRQRAGDDRAHGGGEMAQELMQIVDRRVEGDPSNGTIEALAPLADEDALAVAAGATTDVAAELTPASSAARRCSRSSAPCGAGGRCNSANRTEEPRWDSVIEAVRTTRNHPAVPGARSLLPSAARTHCSRLRGHGSPSHVAAPILARQRSGDTRRTHVALLVDYSPGLPCMMPPSAKTVVAVR